MLLESSSKCQTDLDDHIFSREVARSMCTWAPPMWAEARGLRLQCKHVCMSSRAADALGYVFHGSAPAGQQWTELRRVMNCEKRSKSRWRDQTNIHGST